MVEDEKLRERYKSIPFDVILACSTFRRLEVVHVGSGWVGTRYNVYTTTDGTGQELQTLEDVKMWLVRKQAYWIDHILKCDYGVDVYTPVLSLPS